MRTLIVCGSAPCVHADLAAALAMYPAAETMTVNGCAGVIARAEHVLAGHTEHAEVFHAARRAKFPNAPAWRLHAGWLPHHARRGVPPRDRYPSVTDWWANVSSGATSAGKACLIGLEMGFDLIVLAGAPLDGSGYVRGEVQVSSPHGMQRVGCPTLQGRRTVVRYRERFAELAATTFAGRVRSMSGFTREIVGAPPAVALPEFLRD